MIYSLEGVLTGTREKFAVISAGGIGYKVYLTPDVIASLPQTGDRVSLFIYHAIREDAEDLYGFRSEDERNIFEMLLGVSGIGPKSALAILAVASIETLTHAIASGDTGYLTKVSGIGRKTAEKIVLELRDSMKALGGSDDKTVLRAESDAVEALRSLGYSLQEARDALKNVSTEGDTNARIKEALKILSGK